jgi:uncharacterized membrane protein (GlpM family)
MTTRTHAQREARRLVDSVAGPIFIDPAKCREVRAGDLAIRFGFGFVVSVLAGIVTLVAGNHVGGLFLAFPAILPASLTLIGAKEGDDQAELDAAGAVIGAVGMIGFALTAFFLFGAVNAVAAEAAALLCWLAASTGLYLLLRRLLRRHRGVAGMPARRN